jgi:hypothetical protein
LRRRPRQHAGAAEADDGDDKEQQADADDRRQHDPVLGALLNVPVA